MSNLQKHNKIDFYIAIPNKIIKQISLLILYFELHSTSLSPFLLFEKLIKNGLVVYENTLFLYTLAIVTASLKLLPIA